MPDQTPVQSTWPLRRMIGILLLSFVGGLALFFAFLPWEISLSPNPIRLVSTTSGTTLPPLMTDGVNVYYQQSKAGKFSMSLLPLGGGASRRLALELGSPDPGVVAPNGGSMLLRDLQGNKDGDEPLYLQPLPSGTPTRLGSIRAYDSAWMPGGRHIIYSSGRTVYQSLRDGTAVRKLFDVPGRGYWFRWSPDGRTLRFTVYDSTMGAYSIWQASSGDLQPAPVSFGLGDRVPQCCGTWAPDGSRYYFQAQVDDYFHVFAFNEKRPAFPGPAVQLTSGPSNYRSPVPLPAGDRLLVLNQTQKAEVTRFDAKSRRWLPLFEGIPAATVAFSPDGKTVAFTRLPDHSLWRCSFPACSDPIALIPGPSRVTMPRWSPDGTQISCMVKTGTGKWRAGTIAASGTAGFIAIPDALAEADPVWSPTGDRIAFGATPNPDTGGEASIHVLHRNANRVEVLPGSQGLHSPAWSPDGRFLAAVRADTREVTLLDFGEKRWTRPLRSSRAGYLSWSSSGDRLFFLAGTSIREQVVNAFYPDTGEVKTVAEFSGIQRPVFSFGDWIGIDPEGAPLALRDLSSEEILSWPLSRK